MKTVLVIDDDRPILEIYAMALAEQGYRVVTAASGAEGLELARRHLPDLILCDINMPGMDGRAVLQAVRSDPDLGARQFVFMTGNTSDVTPRRGMELGADDFLVKPFSLQDLTRSVRARLDRASVHWRVEDRIVAGLRADLHSALPHEFFTPLNGILGLVEVLRGDLDQLRREEVVELLDAIEESGWRLHRSLRNYLLLIDLQSEAKAEHPHFLSGPALESAVQAGVASALRRRPRADDVRIEVADVAVGVVASDLTIITEELVDNACRFSRQGTEVRVTLGADGVLTVADHGRGMTQKQIARIGAFQGLDRARMEQEGLGLGLFLIQELAKHCDATLDIESNEGDGTRVRVGFRTLDA